jgi:hypothetical protein
MLVRMQPSTISLHPFHYQHTDIHPDFIMTETVSFKT